MTEVKRSLYSFTLTDLRDYLETNGFAKYACDQIYGWLYKKFEFDMEKWSNVSKKIRSHFEEHLDLSLPKIITAHKSVDGTEKYLLAFPDGETVESVLIPAKDRLTVCLSSQVGCAIGCTFCHTATQGFKRNLGSHEVLGQLLVIQKRLMEERGETTRVSNLVYMGQGEPLHNFDNMKQATEIFMEPKGLGFGQRKITLSTSGLVPKVEKLDEFPPVNIAISLHAAHDEVRSELMPINKVYDLKRLFKAIKTIPLKAHRRITYEYLLIDGLNDSEKDLDALEQLITKHESKMNIIPFNDYPGSKFKSPSDQKVFWFNEELNRRGFTSTVRISKGQDILAACGQLKSQYKKT